MSRFQSTRPIRGATCAQSIVEFAQDISIHAPHTGRDTPWSTPWTGSPYFNPRAPYGARLALIWRPAHDQNFNPRAPYGARPGRTGEPIRGAFSSIHAPHTGRDVAVQESRYGVLLFQSTRPIRGATWGMVCRSGMVSYFNPRAPYGARRTAEGGKLYKITFQSTRPIRGATWPTRPYAPHSTAFQSTRPIRGATGAETLQDYLHLFQSTRPIRGATGMDNSGKTTLVFQSTRPIRGATPECLS